MKNKKVLNIEEIHESLSRTSVQEKRPFQLGLVVALFCLLMGVLAVCFVMEKYFTVNQMSFLGIFGASVISVFAIIVTLHHERRASYLAARKSALMLSDILDSVYSQIERIKNGSFFVIAYPDDWIRYYENCCTYLKYNYLPYLLREFDFVEKLNQCIETEDQSGAQKILNYRKMSITDWTLDFDIISAKSNLFLFASGNSESPPWTQQKPYKEFKKFIMENYGGRIKELTVLYLKNHDGHCDATNAETYVMQQLQTDAKLQSGSFRHIAMENRAMRRAIFSVYLSRQYEDVFGLCWGELTLKNTTAVADELSNDCVDPG